MIILRIEHKVPSFDGWKKAFDSDPIGRKKSGVIRYRVYRPSDDSNYAIVDLEFDSIDKAKNMHADLQVLWGKVEGTIMTGPQTRFLEIIEVKEC